MSEQIQKRWAKTTPDFDLQSNWEHLQILKGDYIYFFLHHRSGILPASEHAVLIFSDSDNDNWSMGFAICGLSSIEVEADLFRWSSMKFLDSLRIISFRFSFSENPRRIFLQGCCAAMSRLLRGCSGALGLLKLAKGRDSGEVISSQNLVISGELLTVFSCKFFVSTMEKHRRKGVRLGETSESMLPKSNFLRSCRTWKNKGYFSEQWTTFLVLANDAYHCLLGEQRRGSIVVVFNHLGNEFVIQ